jgi:hypothetical protein
MTSTLQAQLQQIAAAAGIVSKKPRGKPSLLYTFQEAADIGLQDVYEVALQGGCRVCILSTLKKIRCRSRALRPIHAAAH